MIEAARRLFRTQGLGFDTDQNGRLIN